MDDLPKDFQPLDPGRVHADDPLEMRWWAREFGCSEQQLQDAVAAVGEHVTKIREHLAQRR